MLFRSRYLNKNYATFLPLLDKLFGSHYLPSQRWPHSYGLPVERDRNLAKISVAS